jgi:N-acetylmuramoyl-L-alanine amidase
LDLTSYEAKPFVATNSPPVQPATNPPASAVKKSVPAPNLPTPAYVVPPESWVPFERWAKQNHLSVTDLSSPGAPMFGLRAPKGEFIIRPGSNLAAWSGLELRLGFEPQLMDDAPYIHRLDLQKNLVPLLVGSSPHDLSRRTIVLDAGHGGTDSGTRSAEGDLEKDYTLDWALRLAKLLRAEGWTVALTRTNDVQMSLAERVAFADRHKADLFLSLHFNATAQPYHAGIETYCVTPIGMPSNVTRGYEDNATLVFPNNLFDAQNLQLAVNIHRAILKATDGRDRGVRRARFLSVLRAQNRPAVLIEGGYLSNPDEAQLIVSEAYREKLAQAVADALK